MLTIWKFPVSIEAAFKVTLPEGAEIVHIETRGGATFMWAIVDTRAPREVVELRLVVTGGIIDRDFERYIGTFFDGPYVGHLFGRG
jgi:hypothetical protein